MEEQGQKCGGEGQVPEQVPVPQCWLKTPGLESMAGDNRLLYPYIQYLFWRIYYSFEGEVCKGQSPASITRWRAGAVGVHSTLPSCVKTSCDKGQRYGAWGYAELSCQVLLLLRATWGSCWHCPAPGCGIWKCLSLWVACTEPPPGLHQSCSTRKSKCTAWWISGGWQRWLLRT